MTSPLPFPAAFAIQAIVLAPHGRDSAVAAALLREIGVESHICIDVADMAAAIDEDTGFLLIAEEALVGADLRGIVARLEAQPPWSDLPVVVLTRGRAAEPNPRTARLAEWLGNVTFVERPFHPATFVSVARTAIKGRLRQYEVRARVEELHESEQRLRTALLAGRLGPFELAVASRELTASPTARSVFGRREDEPLGFEDLVASIHPDDRTATIAALQATIDDGSDFATECRVVWPDGSLHWAEFRARLARERAGGAARLVGVASDVTERKTAEEQLKRLNESLEGRVAARTTELQAANAAMQAEILQREEAEQRLRHAQKMETMGQLTGGIAHDFNNLLMAVLGNLELLAKRLQDDPRAQRLIDGAVQGARRGAVLTQRLLAFAHRQELEVRPGDLVALVRGMTDLIERSINPRIELRFELPARLPAALFDANQVELAVLNLVVNARDAMPEGGVLTIAVDHARADMAVDDLRAGRYLRLTVRDTGHGMDAETLSRATEPFFSTKGLGKGTGLGLSMIHGLAAQLGGTLRLSSAVGHGTSAELWLPATTSGAAQSAAGAEPAPRSAEPARRRRLVVLVVDDDPLIAMSTADMLIDLGHEALEALSAEKALEMLRSGTPVDVLLTDYAMPRMNGAQLAEQARALYPDLPVLLATGYAELPPGTSLDLPRLRKPYQQRELAIEIERTLRAAGSGEA